MASERGFSRRQVVSGALGVGAATAVGVTIARAQTSTPSAGTSGSSASGGSASTAQSEYKDFVAKLAANLGNPDATKVDSAIRTTLKQMVDEQLAAGNISANAATSLKQQIDSSTFPAGLRLFDLGSGPGGPGGHGRQRGSDNDNDQEQNKGTSPSNSTPAATPATT